MTFAALLLAVTFGGLMVTALWPRERSVRYDLVLILPLGAMLGMGATSVVFFVASLISPRPALIGGVIECVTIAVLLWRTRRRWIRDAREPAVSSPSWFEWLLGVAFVQFAAVAAVIAWRAWQAEPLGGWDGWAIWNLHARFMLRGGPGWPDLLSAPQLNWTHPDYPRLVPASVARIWASSGEESSLGSAVISMLFAAATVALLVAAVRRMRGRVPALAGGMVLLGTPFFVTFASNQHADIPLGACMLGAVVLAVFASETRGSRGGWALAGICAGCAAWTKNEGLLFALVFAVSGGVCAWRSGSRSALLSLLGALAIALLPVAYFKLRLASANDLMSTPIGPRLGQLFDPARHVAILSSLWHDLGRFGEWQVIPWIALVLPFAAWRSRRRLGRAGRLVPVVVGLMLAGYYGVYLISPQELQWHLDTSLVRLLLQVWPLVIFGWCLVLPVVGDAVPVSSLTSHVSRRLIFAGVSCALAVGIVGALSMQRGANELAVRRIGLAEMSAMLGDGWFALEKHGADEWAWSSGRAGLRLHVSGPEAAASVTLQFGLRGVGARSVTVSNGAQILWRGQVGEIMVPVTIAGLNLPPGTSTLEFATDAPGVAESAAAGGRSLAFALYNVRLK